jgi:ABC-type bacteriocin/lantibiotic exporter with double-glycine peptidase domain
MMLRLLRPYWIVIGFAAAVGTNMSCAVPVGSPPAPLSYQSEVHRLAVPFFPDDSDQCGPVTLASILAYWGTSAPLQDLQDEVYLPALHGSLPMDLVTAAQARGLDAMSYRGSLSNIMVEINKGHPLVALLDSGYWIFSKGHFVVITGYDALRGGVYVHSGTSADLFIPYERFLDPWNKTGRWTLRIIPAHDGPT